MKKFLYLALALTTIVAGCKKDDDDDDDDVVVQPQPYMEFSFNGTKYTSDDDNSSVNGQRQESGGIVAYNMLGSFGSLDIDVRISTEKMSTGTYNLETGTSIRLFGSNSTYSSINGTGTIVVSDYADDRGKGTFSCTMTNFSDTIELTGGKFEDIFLPN